MSAITARPSESSSSTLTSGASAMSTSHSAVLSMLPSPPAAPLGATALRLRLGLRRPIIVEQFADAARPLGKPPFHPDRIGGLGIEGLEKRVIRGQVRGQLLRIAGVNRSASGFPWAPTRHDPAGQLEEDSAACFHSREPGSQFGIELGETLFERAVSGSQSHELILQTCRVHFSRSAPHSLRILGVLRGARRESGAGAAPH